MTPQFSVFSPASVEKIHQASLKILETVGIKVDSQSAIEIFQAAGANINDGNIVKFSSSLVEDALDKCSPTLTLFHRNSDETMVLGDGSIKHSVGGWMSEIRDWRTGEYRKATLHDLEESVIICDALDEISWFMSPLVCDDVTPSQLELYQFKLAVEHSNKPLILSASDAKTVRQIAHLASILAGGQEKLKEKPSFAISVGLMSPLLITQELCEISMTCAELGIPIFLYTSSMAGANSPVTLAGTLAGNHAEILAAITLVKLVNPDAKIIYNSYSKIFDMKSADVSPGNPEFGLLMAGIIQLGKHAGLPTGSGMFYSDSPLLDVQAGMEKVGGSFLPMLSGADFSSGMGVLAKASVHSIEAMVIDAEAVSYFNRILKGVDLDEDRLAVEVFQEVKPLGNFLATKHTREHFRSELWNSKFAYKKSYSVWTSGGQKDSITGNVKALIADMIKKHQPPGLPADFKKEFEKIEGK